MSWPDVVVLGTVALFAWGAVRRGFLSVLLSLLGFVLALIVAFTFYPLLAEWITGTFGWSPVWSRPLGFVALWSLSNLLFEGLERLLVARMGYGLQESRANRLLAIVPGALQGLLAAAVLLTMLALVPWGGNARRDITSSPIGGRLVSATLAVERPLEGIFGPAARETLGFITTIRPPTGRPGGGSDSGSGSETGSGSHESQALNFTVEDGGQPDPQTEEGMLALVNGERTSRGLGALAMDPELRLVARAHAEDMFKRGYFAHDTPNGVDPFERMGAANILFALAGENLALAPTLEIAHNGLMNSPGHRANILKPEFGRVGIGVLDGGIYGKMFVQEFTD